MEKPGGFSEYLVSGSDARLVRRIPDEETGGPAVVLLDQLQRSTSSVGRGCGQSGPGEDCPAGASARSAGCAQRSGAILRRSGTRGSVVRGGTIGAAKARAGVQHAGGLHG